MEFHLPYLMCDVDRHGNARAYVRKRGQPKVRLPLPFGSPEFLDAYKAAVAGENLPALKPKGAPAIASRATDTLRHVVHLFENAPEGKTLTERGQHVRHLILQGCLDEPTKPGSDVFLGECPIEKVTIDLIRVMRDRKADKKAASANRVKYMRQVLDFAVERRLLDRNVARDLKIIPYKKEGFHTWTEDELLKFEARHPIGTKARLAMAIMAFTGMRRSDACALGPQHVKDGWLTFTPIKTKRTTGQVLTLPLLPCLRQVIDASEIGATSFLATSRGAPFDPAVFGNWFRERCDEAGLPHCTAHGLRKAGAVLAADNGATEKQMMAIFGWSSGDLAAYYSRKASQKKLAGAAMHLLVPQGSL